MIDMSKTIKPKTDQLNFDDFIGGKSMTVKVTDVKGNDAKDQPISVCFENDNGKPYKPCLSMRRVLVHIWGNDGKAYVGKSMTLFGDPNVVFGGIKVGGIRISHMSDMDGERVMALTASKAQRKPYVVKPLVVKQERAEQSVAASHDTQASTQDDIEYISADQHTEITDLLTGHADVRAELVKTFGGIAKIPAARYAKVLDRARELVGEAVP